MKLFPVRPCGEERSFEALDATTQNGKALREPCTCPKSRVFVLHLTTTMCFIALECFENLGMWFGNMVKGGRRLKCNFHAAPAILFFPYEPTASIPAYFTIIDGS
ncbi:hypothetical protein FRB91_004573 [Serendipita sp. 411]|nr:hypothetical protein FRB91_004573 [Serendipita sp. 411]